MAGYNRVQSPAKNGENPKKNLPPAADKNSSASRPAPEDHCQNCGKKLSYTLFPGPALAFDPASWSVAHTKVTALQRISMLFVARLLSLLLLVSAQAQTPTSNGTTTAAEALQEPASRSWCVSWITHPSVLRPLLPGEAFAGSVSSPSLEENRYTSRFSRFFRPWQTW